MRQNKLNFLFFLGKEARYLSHTVSYMLNVIHQMKVLNFFSDFSAENLIKKRKTRTAIDQKPNSLPLVYIKFKFEYKREKNSFDKYFCTENVKSDQFILLILFKKLLSVIT